MDRDSIQKELQKRSNVLSSDQTKQIEDFANQNKGAILKTLRQAGYVEAPLKKQFIIGEVKSRIAERVRLGEPWCSTLLHAPSVDNDSDGFSKENDAIRTLVVRKYWEPGFVIQYRDVVFWPDMEDPEDSKGDAVVAIHFGEGFGQMFFYLRPKWIKDFGYCLGSQLSFPMLDGSGSPQGAVAAPFFSKPYLNHYVTNSIQASICESREEAIQMLATLVSDTTLVLAYQLKQTFGLLECKNVGRKLIERKRKRRTKGRSKREVDSYYVLDIPGSPSYWKPKNPEEQVSGGIRHHAVRGHFKTYTEDAPLFGSKVGKFWIPAHSRGNPDHGRIDKDYNLDKGLAETPIP